MIIISDVLFESLEYNKLTNLKITNETIQNPNDFKIDWTPRLEKKLTDKAIIVNGIKKFPKFL